MSYKARIYPDVWGNSSKQILTLYKDDKFFARWYIPCNSNFDMTRENLGKVLEEAGEFLLNA